jgi:hypothetical protein
MLAVSVLGNSKDAYTHLGNYNCYKNGSNGVIDLETPPGSTAGNMTLQACWDVCSGTDKCTSVVVERFNVGDKYHKDTYQCYRRARILNVNKCLPWKLYDLYNNSAAQPVPATGGWNVYHDTNCWQDHGADDVETPPMSPAGHKMTPDACRAACTGMGGLDACDSVTMGPAVGGVVDCYRRKNTNVANCDKDDGTANGFTTSVRPAPPAPSPPTPGM